MGNFGAGELLIIAVIVLLVFGAGRISDIGKGLGQGISNFKKGLKEGDEAEKADGVGDTGFHGISRNIPAIILNQK